MPRPIEYDRDQVLQKAMELFWINGYAQTSVRDVLETTKFNRHSLYEEFGGKDGLYKEVLNYYKDNIACQLIDTFLKKDSDIETIKQLFKLKAESSGAQSTCLYANTAQSKHVIDDGLYKIAKNYNQKVEKALESCIKQAQTKHQIPSNKDSRVLSRYLFTVLHGLGVMSKMGISKKEIKAIGDITIESLISE